MLHAHESLSTPSTAKRIGEILQPEKENPNLGILNVFMNDEAISDILVSGLNNILVERAGKLIDTAVRFSSESELNQVVDTLIQASGRTLDKARLLADLRLEDGTRVHIIAPPMSVDGTSISIRKFPTHRITLDKMVAAGTLTLEIAKFLEECVRQRVNLVIAGGTGTGKTTLLGALSSGIPASERVVTIEDSAELRLQVANVARLEAKPACPNTGAAVTLKDLVRHSLRMRPDRLIVGECRGDETVDMLQAMNTGHHGSMTTLHANSPRDAVTRLETLVAFAAPQLRPQTIKQQIAATINLFVQMERDEQGVRRIERVCEVVGIEGETIVMHDLITYNRQRQTYQCHGLPRNPKLVEFFEVKKLKSLLQG